MRKLPGRVAIGGYIRIGKSLRGQQWKRRLILGEAVRSCMGMVGTMAQQGITKR